MTRVPCRRIPELTLRTFLLDRELNAFLECVQGLRGRVFKKNNLGFFLLVETFGEGCGVKGNVEAIYAFFRVRFWGLGNFGRLANWNVPFIKRPCEIIAFKLGF